MLGAAGAVVAVVPAVTVTSTSASTTVTSAGAAHLTLVLDGRTYVIPADAQLLVASGALDLSLFEGGATSAWRDLTEPDPAVGGVGLGSRRMRAGAHVRPKEFLTRAAAVGITVRYVDRAGRPTATAYSMLRNVDDPSVFAFVAPEPDGTGRATLPPGRYLMESTVDTPRPGRLDPAVSVAVNPLLSVDRDTELVVDARAARPVSVTVPDRAAAGVGALAAFRRTVNGGQVRSVYGSPDVTALFTLHDGPTVPAADFESAVGVLFTRLPVVYATGWRRDGAFFTGFRQRVAESDLSTVRARFDTVAPGRAAVRSYAIAQSSGAAAQSLDIGSLPADRIERYAGNARWANVLTEYTAGTEFEDAVTQEQTPTAYAPGRTYTEHWNATPYWPVPRVTRDGSSLIARFAMFSDASGVREGTGSTSRARVDLYRDGTPVGTADRLDGVAFPLAAGRYTLTATAERSWTPISSRTTVTWTFTTADLSLPSIRFTKAGPRTLHVHGVSLETLTVDASYDGGRTWQPATVTADLRAATLPRDPGRSPVSLRARAKDRTGATVDQTTINAYIAN